MNPEVKKNWLAALRSGEYQQGKDYLHRDGSFCCLGVLTDLYLKEHKLEWEACDNHSGVYHLNGNSEGLTPEVMKWASLEKSDPYISELSNTLSGLNDDPYEPLNFTTLAKFIEAEL